MDYAMVLIENGGARMVDYTRNQAILWKYRNVKKLENNINM